MVCFELSQRILEGNGIQTEIFTAFIWKILFSPQNIHFQKHGGCSVVSYPHPTLAMFLLFFFSSSRLANSFVFLQSSVTAPCCSLSSSDHCYTCFYSKVISTSLQLWGLKDNHCFFHSELQLAINKKNQSRQVGRPPFRTKLVI